MRTRIGHGDFIDLIWVEPDLATATLEDARGEPLLELERNHVCFFLFGSLSLTKCFCFLSLFGCVSFVITGHRCPLFGCRESGGNGRKMMFA